MPANTDLRPEHPDPQNQTIGLSPVNGAGGERGTSAFPGDTWHNADGTARAGVSQGEGPNPGKTYYASDPGRKPAQTASTGIRVNTNTAPSSISLTPATGLAAGGTVVTIHGANLGGSTGVTFGGTAGTAFTVKDDDTATVTTPAKAAGTYSVIVQNPEGNSTGVNFVYT